MARMHHLVGFLALGLLLPGCVAQEKYTALRLERDRLAEQLGAAQTSEAAARSEAEILKNQMAALMNGGTNKDALSQNLSAQNAELQRQLEDLNRRYSEIAGKVATGSPLPQPLTNELSNFAAQNPDLVDFDAARGIVKFKSDVTFAPGSAEVTPKVRDVITRFSQILNSPGASGYELIVAGHTDNTNVVNPATIQAGHKDNWYLSAHRAIAVNAELVRSRVATQRLAVTGYADQRPVASNGSESGKAANRRVEVLILPTTVRGGGNNVAGSATPAKAKLNKDSSATIDNRPALNK